MGLCLKQIWIKLVMLAFSGVGTLVAAGRKKIDEKQYFLFLYVIYLLCLGRWAPFPRDFHNTISSEIHLFVAAKRRQGSGFALVEASFQKWSLVCCLFCLKGRVGSARLRI
jgi:hypothetical protein